MKKLIYIYLLIASVVALAAPVKRMLGADGNEVSEEETGIPYITDGLVFLGESIMPPTSGGQVIPLDTPVNTSEAWTLEICGDYLGVAKRENMFLALSHSTTYVPRFSIGFWINSDNATINGRIYNGEVSLRQTINDTFHIAYAIDPQTPSLRFYGNGNLISSVNANLVTAALGQMSSECTSVVSGYNQRCYIRSIRVYNRQLSDEEIMFNYLVDKSQEE